MIELVIEVTNEDHEKLTRVAEFFAKERHEGYTTPKAVAELLVTVGVSGLSKSTGTVSIPVTEILDSFPD